MCQLKVFYDKFVEQLIEFGGKELVREHKFSYFIVKLTTLRS